MNNLTYMLEIDTNGYLVTYLDLAFFVSIIFTVLVIVSKNPIVSVLFLIGLFFTIACNLMLLGINFIGLSYLLVYVGAVSILFLFILMLINVRISELVTNSTNSIPLVFIVAIFFTYPLQQIIPTQMLGFFIYNYIVNFNQHLPYIYSNTINFYLSDYQDVYYVCSKVWDGNLAEKVHITSIGNIMYTNYSMWLIITSVILLLAMVGAIMITVKV